MKKWDRKSFLKNLRHLQPLIEECKEKGMNEAETRRRLEKILVELLGYDSFKDLTGELLVRGTGTDHLDYAVKLKDQIKFIIELKPACCSLGEKHLRQVIAYGMNSGTEWCLLTNSVDWQLYHITFAKPIKPNLVMNFNFLTDDPNVLFEKMGHLAKCVVGRNGLDKLWQKTEGLSAANIFRALLVPSSLNSIRRNIRQETGISVAPEEIVGAFRKILNERALNILNNMDITFSEKKPKKRPKKEKDINSELPAEKPIEKKEDTPPQTTET